MAEVINLRRARKARARTEAQQQASENRVRHGQDKATKRKQLLEQDRATRLIEGARRDTP